MHFMNVWYLGCITSSAIIKNACSRDWGTPFGEGWENSGTLPTKYVVSCAQFCSELIFLPKYNIPIFVMSVLGVRPSMCHGFCTYWRLPLNEGKRILINCPRGKFEWQHVNIFKIYLPRSKIPLVWYFHLWLETQKEVVTYLYVEASPVSSLYCLSLIRCCTITVSLFLKQNHAKFSNHPEFKAETSPPTITMRSSWKVIIFNVRWLNSEATLSLNLGMEYLM